MNELDLFAAALAIADMAERSAMLDRECAGQPGLRERLKQLLDAHSRSNPLLDQSGFDRTRTQSGQANTIESLPAEAAGTIIAGKYKLLQLIGEGGMGAVWMADQTEPVKRRVAVKLIQVERGSSKTILSRFEAERQAIAMMDHPHIAKLLDAGTTQAGSPYFVMELVKGIPLTEYCDTHKLSIQHRLGLFQQICSAVQHAHQKGIIHRDLKPTNILVESHDGKPVPKVIDFGLAKATSGLQLTEHSLFTAFGSVMGTPLYMAPEQANFNAIDVDTRADIYSLGVILYELLTGTTPLTRDTVKKVALDEMLKLVREQEAPTPSSRLSSARSSPSVAANRQSEPAKLGRFVKGELDWIVLKALSKERDRRYETANGFARDIERFLNHEPVQAGPQSAGYRLRTFARRNKRVLAAVAGFALLLVSATALSIGLAAWAIRAETATHQALEEVTGEQKKTQAALGRETSARDDALERLRESYYMQAQANRWSGRPGRRFDSLVALAKAAAIPSVSRTSLLELRNESITSLALPDVSSQPIWTTGLPNSGALAMHPDFQHYATWSRENGAIYVRRCADHTEAARFPTLMDSIWPVVFSPDGRFLAFGSRGDAAELPTVGKRYRLDVWDWKQRTQVLTTADTPLPNIGAFFSPDSSRLLVNWRRGKVVNYDLRGNQPPVTLPVSGVVVAFHPDGTKVAVADGKTVLACDAVTGRAISNPVVAAGTVFAANWSPDGQLLAIGCGNTHAYIHDASTGAMRARLVGHQAEVNRVFFSPDGSLLVSSGYDNVSRLWSPYGGRHLVTAKGKACDFSRDGTQLNYVNGSQAGVWQVAYGREYRELWGHTCFKGPGGVRWLFGSRLVASSGDDATRLWDPATGKQLGLIPVSGNRLQAHPDGTCWYTGGMSGSYRWPVGQPGTDERLRIGPPENLYEGSATNLNGIDLSPDGQWLVVIDRPLGQVIVRSTINPAQQKTFADFVELAGAVISPDNRWLAVGGWPRPWIHIFDLNTERCVHKIPLLSTASFSFSPDSKWLAFGNPEGGRLLEVGPWTRHREIPPRKGSRVVGAHAFSRDGRTLAVAREDHVIQLLDVDTLTEFAALESPTPAPSNGIEFSPDDSRLAVSCGTRVVHLWDLRAIRHGLAQLGLDWNAPTYRDASPSSTAPPTIEIIATGLVDPAALRRGLELNTQAWMLLAGPPEQRDAIKGLALVQEAMKLRPDDAMLMNTLGVAQYRNGKYRDAVTIFEKSLAAGKGQWDGFDLFFLAMTHAKLGDKEKARECFDRAVRWVEQRKNLTPAHIAELKLFRAEAEPLLR